MNKRVKEFLQCLGNGKTENQLDSECDAEMIYFDKIDKLEEKRK